MPKLLIFIVLGCLKAGCTPTEAVHSDYVSRIADVLEVDPTIVKQDVLPPPTIKNVRLPIPALDINALQFAELHRCDLGDLAGERNSGLGRFAASSQRLGYEARWQCRSKSCDIDWLVKLNTEKAALMPKLLWNATLGGPEFASFLRGRGETVTPVAIALLSEQIARIYPVLDCEFSQVAFEDSLNQVRLAGGIALRRGEWAKYRTELLSVAATLASRDRPLCLNQAPTAKAKRLFAVFRRFYVNELQPKMSQGLQADQPWIYALAALDRPFKDIAPDAWRRFYAQSMDPESSDSEWNRTQAAIVSHSQAWQHIFDQCGIDIRGVMAGE